MESSKLPHSDHMHRALMYNRRLSNLLQGECASLDREKRRLGQRVTYRQYDLVQSVGYSPEFAEVLTNTLNQESLRAKQPRDIACGGCKNSIDERCLERKRTLESIRLKRELRNLKEHVTGLTNVSGASDIERSTRMLSGGQQLLMTENLVEREMVETFFKTVWNEGQHLSNIPKEDFQTVLNFIRDPSRFSNLYKDRSVLASPEHSITTIHNVDALTKARREGTHLSLATDSDLKTCIDKYTGGAGLRQSSIATVSTDRPSEHVLRVQDLTTSSKDSKVHRRKLMHREVSRIPSAVQYYLSEERGSVVERQVERAAFSRYNNIEQKKRQLALQNDQKTKKAQAIATWRSRLVESRRKYIKEKFEQHYKPNPKQDKLPPIDVNESTRRSKVRVQEATHRVPQKKQVLWKDSGIPETANEEYKTNDDVAEATVDACGSSGTVNYPQSSSDFKNPKQCLQKKSDVLLSIVTDAPNTSSQSLQGTVPLIASKQRPQETGPVTVPLQRHKKMFMSTTKPQRAAKFYHPVNEKAVGKPRSTARTPDLLPVQTTSLSRVSDTEHQSTQPKQTASLPRVKPNKVAKACSSRDSLPQVRKPGFLPLKHQWYFPEKFRGKINAPLEQHESDDYENLFVDPLAEVSAVNLSPVVVSQVDLTSFSGDSVNLRKYKGNHLKHNAPTNQSDQQLLENTTDETQNYQEAKSRSKETGRSATRGGVVVVPEQDDEEAKSSKETGRSATRGGVVVVPKDDGETKSSKKTGRSATRGGVVVLLEHDDEETKQQIDIDKIAMGSNELSVPGEANSGETSQVTDPLVESVRQAEDHNQSLKGIVQGWHQASTVRSVRQPTHVFQTVKFVTTLHHHNEEEKHREKKEAVNGDQQATTQAIQLNAAKAKAEERFMNLLKSVRNNQNESSKWENLRQFFIGDDRIEIEKYHLQADDETFVKNVIRQRDLQKRRMKELEATGRGDTSGAVLHRKAFEYLDKALTTFVRQCERALRPEEHELDEAPPNKAMFNEKYLHLPKNILDYLNKEPSRQDDLIHFITAAAMFKGMTKKEIERLIIERPVMDKDTGANQVASIIKLLKLYTKMNSEAEKHAPRESTDPSTNDRSHARGAVRGWRKT